MATEDDNLVNDGHDPMDKFILDFDQVVGKLWTATGRDRH
jgi:hypothetical protein